MQKFPSIAVPILAIAALALGSAQGRRLGYLEESERFYRWIVSASTQMRLFGDPGKPPPGEDPQKYVDDELFTKLVDLTEPILPDVPVGETDYNKLTGKPLAKVVRYTAAPHVEETTEAAPEDDGAEEQDKTGQGQKTIYTEEQRQRDAALWSFALSPESSALRKELWGAHRDGRIAAFGTQLGVEGLYQERGTQISLANMFFGFRKMAANLVWLEVDRYWHKGQMHRMLPLMKTCVTLDPEFIDAYLLGAWHMAYNATASMTDTSWELRNYDSLHETWVGDKERYYFYGVDFLKDGIRKNPRNYKLYFDLGFSIYEIKLDNHVDAIKYLSEAIRLDHDRWVRRTLYRLKGIDERYEESKEGWEDYLSQWPSNLVAPRFIKFMEGEILDRETDYAAKSARVADQLLARAQERGDAAAVAQWTTKAAEAQAKETEFYAKAKAFWSSIFNEDVPEHMKETYAGARLLRIEAMEQRSAGLYEEAAITIDRARWLSNEFWDAGTKLLMEIKQEGKLPMALTDVRYIERVKVEEEYTRHLSRSIAGRLYRFTQGTWTCVSIGPGAGYQGEEVTPIEQDSTELLELEYTNPEIVRVVQELDGNIVLKAGDKWYEYRSKEPAKKSKLYDPAQAA